LRRAEKQVTQLGQKEPLPEFGGAYDVGRKTSERSK